VEDDAEKHQLMVHVTKLFEARLRSAAVAQDRRVELRIDDMLPPAWNFEPLPKSVARLHFAAFACIMLAHPLVSCTERALRARRLAVNKFHHKLHDFWVGR
jgi:hypothetical protein